MAQKKSEPGPADEVRKRAEKIAGAKAAAEPENLEGFTADKIRQSLHELRVHQIELAMQNDELRRTQGELAKAKARYLDLYELVPVGYFTVSEKGLILEANLTAAAMLGVPRSALVKRPLARFILREDHDFYYRRFKRFVDAAPALAGRAAQAVEVMICDLRLTKKDGMLFWGQLTMTAAAEEGGANVYRVALSDITDRKRAEAALKEEEEKFKTIFEQAGDGILITDARTRKFIQGNAAVCSMLGYSKEEIQNLTVNEIHPPDVLSRVLEEFEKQAKGEKKLVEDVPVLRKDGSIFYADISSAYTNIGGGECLVGVFRDITRRREVKRRQSLVAEILSIINEAPALSDTINHILQSIKREMGYDAVGIRLRNGEDFPYYVQNGFSDDFLLTENTLTVWDQDAGICRDENGNIRLECTCGLVISGLTDPTNPFFTQRGSFWTNNSLSLLYLPAALDPRLHPRNKCIHQRYMSVAIIPIRINKEIIGLLQLNDRKQDCFTLDMIQYLEGLASTIGIALARKQAEAALQEKTLMLDNILRNASNIAIATTDLDFRITYYNPTAEKLFGYSAAQVIGKTVQEMHTKEKVAPERFVEAIEQVRNKGEYRYSLEQNTDKGIRHIESCVTGIIAPTGDMVGYALFSQDFTDRKLAEEKIKTSLLEKETMLREIHHRVKNNLQVISSLLNMQSSYLPDAQLQKALQESIDRVRTMAAIHSQLCQSPDLATVDFDQFIRDLVSNVSQSYRKASFPIKINMDLEEMHISIDTAIPLGLILNELISNSLKHAFPERKKGQIDIKVRSEDKQIVLTVRDNGIGMRGAFDFKEFKTMGMELVRLLVGQIGGKIDLTVDGGTIWTLAFHLKKEREWRNG